MKIYLYKSLPQRKSSVYINGSKSESNRALILLALSGKNISIHNLSDARDTRILKELLSKNEKVLDVLDAGTTMRFLTAYLACTNQNKILTGTERMLQRPLEILVDALREIGADISYLKNEGYPPIEILGLQKQIKNKIKIRGDVSSQYISAILMISPFLQEGLTVELLGEISSRPYIQMTLDLMKQVGIEYEWNKHTIHVSNQTTVPSTISIEPDWSGASYWYAFVALAKDLTLSIPGLKQNSLQGDRIIRTFGSELGVHTEFTDEGVILSKTDFRKNVTFDFTDCPDLAQTIAVICAGKGIQATFSGLKSLRIKETDRILALQKELAKIHCNFVEKNENEFQLVPPTSFPDVIEFDTYDDHRMAMAFAPLSTMMNTTINDPDVVDKSYPQFWEQVRNIGIKTDII